MFLKLIIIAGVIFFLALFALVRWYKSHTIFIDKDNNICIKLPDGAWRYFNIKEGLAEFKHGSISFSYCAKIIGSVEKETEDLVDRCKKLLQESYPNKPIEVISTKTDKTEKYATLEILFNADVSNWIKKNKRFKKILETLSVNNGLEYFMKKTSLQKLSMILLITSDRFVYFEQQPDLFYSVRKEHADAPIQQLRNLVKSVEFLSAPNRFMKVK